MIRFVLYFWTVILFVGCQTNTQQPTKTLATSDSPPATKETNSQQSTDTEEQITETPTPSPQPPAPTSANANVIFVRAVSSEDDTWTFYVTVEHPDTGWEDYADGWDVVLPDDTVVKPNADSPFTRLLTHPHENEQPFTRSQSNIVIPASITSVTVRAHDLVDGFGGKEVLVDLTAVSGTDFEVTR